MSLLEATEISKRFAGIMALDQVSFRVEEGELVGLIGPNGAGKTTLFNCLYGGLRPDGGRVVFGGKDITRAPMYRRSRLGIGRTFQRMELFAGMTVRDHLLVAARAQTSRGGLVRDLTLRSRPTTDEQQHADEVLDVLGLADAADRPIEALSLGAGRLVELGRALMTDPRLLFLDEPSSGLDTHETDEVSAVLEAVNRQHGVAVVLVEHDVTMVRRVTTRLYCLDLGEMIAEGPTTEVLSLPDVLRAYLGEEVA